MKLGNSAGLTNNNSQVNPFRPSVISGRCCPKNTVGTTGTREFRRSSTSERKISPIFSGFSQSEGFAERDLTAIRAELDEKVAQQKIEILDQKLEIRILKREAESQGQKIADQQNSLAELGKELSSLKSHCGDLDFYCKSIGFVFLIVGMVGVLGPSPSSEHREIARKVDLLSSNVHSDLAALEGKFDSKFSENLKEVANLGDQNRAQIADFFRKMDFSPRSRPLPE